MGLELKRLCKMCQSLVSVNRSLSKRSLLLDGLYTTSSAICVGFSESGKIEAQNKSEVEKKKALCFVASLRACARTRDLNRGTIIHDDVVKSGLLDKCTDALVSMYAKCGDFVKAKLLISRHKSRDVFTWNSLVVEYVQRGRNQDALNIFEIMKGEGIIPNAVTFSSILKACGNLRAFEKGKQVHDEIAQASLLQKNIVIGNALVDMYSKCGALVKAHKVLEDLPLRNVISWSALIAGYAQHGKSEEALNCFKLMLREGLSPSPMTFTFVLKACRDLQNCEVGKEIHDAMVAQGLLENNIILGTSLIDMYAKCGALTKARQLLEELPTRNVISWSALIAGYVEHGKYEHALFCFDKMQQEKVFPDAVTFLAILEACGNVGAVEKGDQICEEIAYKGLLPGNISLGSAVVNMYTKCGALSKAQAVHDTLLTRNAVTWSTLIAGYGEQGNCKQAFNALEAMQREGFVPDVVTFTSLLKACGRAVAIEPGERLHDQILENGFLEKDVVLGAALVDMYGKCGALKKARRALENLPTQNVVNWNALLSGYVQHDEDEKALSCYEEMLHEGVSPDAVSFICILKACGHLGALKRGEKLHDELMKQGLLGEDVILGTALLHMYGKCGALKKACQVLEELHIQDIVSWNALMTGSVRKGKCDLALTYYEQLQHGGLSPDAATLSCVLTACSRLGLIDAAHTYLQNSKIKYGINPDLGHYACIVDLFSRAGYLRQAVNVIGKMPSSICGVWYALLGACSKCADVNIGKWAFEQAVFLDKYNAAPYTLMANVYAAAGMQEDAERVNSIRRQASGSPKVVV